MEAIRKQQRYFSELKKRFPVSGLTPAAGSAFDLYTIFIEICLNHYSNKDTSHIDISYFSITNALPVCLVVYTKEINGQESDYHKHNTVELILKLLREKIKHRTNPIILLSLIIGVSTVF
jgi:hypothetical protein